MTINEYIITLRKKRFNPEYAAEKVTIEIRLEYAIAYRKGAEALDEFRDKLIASKLNAVVNRDGQIAILFNQAKHPDEYEAYQKLRVDKKAEADAEMSAMKAELEASLKEAQYEH